jgi:uncharacterized protein
MEFEWDDAKDAANRAKHGLSLADAARLDWDSGLTEPDVRMDYGEDRYHILARLDGRLYFCVFTRREGRTRAISLRKANRREVTRYERSRE